MRGFLVAVIFNLILLSEASQEGTSGMDRMARTAPDASVWLVPYPRVGKRSINPVKEQHGHRQMTPMEKRLYLARVGKRAYMYAARVGK